MIVCKPRDIVLTRFPFTDLRTTKKRPVLVISPRHYSDRYGDVVGLPLTTVEQSDPYLLEDWQQAGLPRQTWIKPLIATFASEHIVSQLGIITSNDWQRGGDVLRLLISQELLHGSNWAENPNG